MTSPRRSFKPLLFVSALWAAFRGARPARHPRAETDFEGTGYAPMDGAGQRAWTTPAPTPAQAFEEAFDDAADAPDAPPVRLRTLEEVRADLAALRERTRVQQAQTQARRDISFAPTDFMGFAEPAAAVPDSPASGFAATDFLDFGTLNPSPGR